MNVTPSCAVFRLPLGRYLERGKPNLVAQKGPFNFGGIRNNHEFGEDKGRYKR